MKKITTIFIVSLILALVVCANVFVVAAAPDVQEITENIENDDPEEPTLELLPTPDKEEDFLGDWYCVLHTQVLTLTLQEEGNYTVTYAGETMEGTWKLEDGFIYLDEDKSPAFLPIGDKLSWIGPEEFLSREEPKTGEYHPGEVLTGIEPGTLDGCWKSIYVDADGIVIPAEDAGDNTDLYLEGETAALGGALFGDVIVDMVFADDALTFAADGVSIVLQLQNDGFMRMTLTTPENEELLIYLIPTYVEGLSPVQDQ